MRNIAAKIDALERKLEKLTNDFEKKREKIFLQIINIQDNECEHIVITDYYPYIPYDHCAICGKEL